jgi:hypothetical protein
MEILFIMEVGFSSPSIERKGEFHYMVRAAKIRPGSSVSWKRVYIYLFICVGRKEWRIGDGLSISLPLLECETVTVSLPLFCFGLFYVYFSNETVTKYSTIISARIYIFFPR